MPYKNSKYIHIRYQDPEYFDKKSFKTVPIQHTKSKLKDKYPNAKARVGQKKQTKKLTKTGKKPWVIQSILIPREEK